MLTPRKHLDLESSLIRVASIMIKELHRRGIIDMPTLRRRVIKRIGANGEMMFLPALGFLFLLGRVDYHVQNDTIEYLAE
jgi:hypothetical protein